MKRILTFYIALIAVNAVVIRYFDWKIDKLLIFSIPVIAEFFKFALLKVVNKKKKNKKAILTIIIESVKFALIVAGLFLFVSPINKENGIYSITYCIDFIIAQFVGSVLMLKSKD